MTTTDPPTMPSGTTNEPTGEIGGNASGTPTALDNIAKGVNPSPKEAEGEMANPAGSIEAGKG